MLWVTTHRSLREIRKQNKNIAHSLKRDTIQQITKSHQDLFLTILSDQVLLATFAKSMGISSKKFTKQMIGTLLINHCAAVHLCSMEELLTSSDWIAIENDILDLFSWPIVKERWPKIRAFYSVEFQKFIDDLISNKEKKMS